MKTSNIVFSNYFIKSMKACPVLKQRKATEFINVFLDIMNTNIIRNLNKRLQDFVHCPSFCLQIDNSAQLLDTV